MPLYKILIIVINMKFLKQKTLSTKLTRIHKSHVIKLKTMPSMIYYYICTLHKLAYKFTFHLCFLFFVFFFLLNNDKSNCITNFINFDTIVYETSCDECTIKVISGGLK